MLFNNPKLSSWNDLLNLAYLADEENKKLLREQSDKYLKLNYNTVNQKFGRWPRLFIHANIMTEVGLSFEYTSESKYLDYLVEYLSEIVRDDEAVRTMFDKYQPHGPGVFVCSLGSIVLLSPKLQSNKLFVTKMLAVIEKFCHFMFEHRKKSGWGDGKIQRLMWNHSVCGFAGLYMGARLLSRFGSKPQLAHDWIDYSENKVLSYVTHGLTSCGVNREGLSYAGMTFKAVSPCLWEVMFHRGGLPIELYSRLKNYVEYVAYEVVPEGGLVWNYNDSYMNPLLGLNGYLAIANLVGKFETGVAVWNELLGEFGSKNFGVDTKLWRSSIYDTCVFAKKRSLLKIRDTGLPTSRYFKDKGYFVTRSSWERNAHALTFSSGKGYDHIHQQSDHNSFTLAVDGTPLIIDSGPSNEREADSASQSYGHQAIHISGQGMSLCGGKYSNSGETDIAYSGENFSLVIGNAVKAYKKNKENTIIKARRYMWVIWKPSPFLIIVDDYATKNNEALKISQWLVHFIDKVSVRKVKNNKFEFLREKGKSAVFQLFDTREVNFEARNFQNKKAYDDNLVVDHKLGSFHKEDVSSIFKVALTLDDSVTISSLAFNSYAKKVTCNIHLMERELKLILGVDPVTLKNLDKKLQKLL